LTAFRGPFLATKRVILLELTRCEWIISFTTWSIDMPRSLAISQSCSVRSGVRVKSYCGIFKLYFLAGVWSRTAVYIVVILCSVGLKMSINDFSQKARCLLPMQGGKSFHSGSLIMAQIDPEPDSFLALGSM
jgi:hypothetical protein